MMIFDRRAGWSAGSQFYMNLLHWLSFYWINVVAIALLFVAATLSLFAFIDSASIQLGQRSVSSALFFSDCTLNESTPFYGYRLALLYNFGCRIAQQLM
ncbi:hypothetical protein IQ250_20925 [Pseudanabaenaceae cyanobacterium LEGE 13415]|nr:hypothetical protein [Pseudanabaenaceae cyanobacterium LEGE 13415]